MPPLHSLSRPYVPIDTCSPAGTWIEEKRYNRARPTASASRKVLCGNWQEEQVLEADMLARETAQQQEQQQQQQQQPHKPAVPLVSLDVIRDVHGTGRYSGGYESTPYLTRDVTTTATDTTTAAAADDGRAAPLTTHRADYTRETSNVRALQRPALGVRRQMLLQQALQAAADAQRTHDAQTLRRQQQQQARRQCTHPRTAVGGYSAHAAAATAVQHSDNNSDDEDDEDEDERHASVYMSTIGNGMLTTTTTTTSACDTVRTRGRQVVPVVAALSDAYVHDEPITVYTGNPQTRQVMYMHGKTPADPHGHTRFGRHTYFTERKYAL